MRSAGDEIVRRFLRYYWRGIVDYAVDLAELDEKELEAVELCGRQRLTVERAAEVADVSANTMQSRWTRARARLWRAWCGLEWVAILAATVDE